MKEYRIRVLIRRWATGCTLPPPTAQAVLSRILAVLTKEPDRPTPMGRNRRDA